VERGSFTVPRSAQGHPVLIQAGPSGRSERVAARRAGLIFVAGQHIARARVDAAAPAGDGDVVAASHVPGAHEDFVRLVVPERQRRGLHQSEYTGTTLRETPALPRPAIGALRNLGRT